MRAAICDDEEQIRQEIRRLIRAEDGELCIDEYTSAEELLASDLHYEMIFLDIHFAETGPDKETNTAFDMELKNDMKNGMEAARQLHEKDKRTVIIFITGIKEYVFDAFDVGAFHYLLKPIDPVKLISVFTQAKQEAMERFEEKKLLIKTRQNSFVLNMRDILYAESRLKKVMIHTNEDVIEYYGTIRELEAELDQAFYRCHRAYIVNMTKIKRYGSDFIIVSNGEQIYLAKERYGDFVDAYMKFLMGGGTGIV